MDHFSYWLERSSLHIALLAAWIAMLGSLYFSEVAHYIPCTLCWYQRILMYPLTLVLAIGLLRRDENTPLLTLPFSVLGIGVSTYHVLLEKTDWFSGAATCQAGVPCTVLWINWFGFITIPFLALIAFLIITVMAVIARQAGEPAPVAEEEPGRVWPSVVAVIAAVVVAFAGLTVFTRTTASAQTPFTPIVAQAAMTQLDGTPISMDNMAVLDHGQQLYLQSCAACHGQRGEGVANLGNSLTTSALVQEGADADILAMIRAGRDVNAADNQSGLAMPPSGGRPGLSDADLLAIVAFLRTKN
ncbi:MAG: disulfide bond formation protein B [Caldilinea sp. CFX5]|nr:disulfide bond formation protein B [Caldilinea sp. CFX5]